MTEHEAPNPAPADIPAGETASSPEELGHLVKGLDFTGIVEYAKTLDIPAFEDYDNMVGSHPITIDGLPATVGWVSHRPGKDVRSGYRTNETPAIEVTNPGGEDVVVVEGHLHAVIADDTTPKRTWAVGRDGRPGFLQFDGGDTIWLSVAHIQHEPTWYVCFYPEVPEPAPTIS